MEKAVGQESGAVETQGSGRPRLLIVDDDVLIRRLFIRFLKKLSLDGVVVDGGAGARAALAQGTFDLVLIDEHLGQELGSKLVGELRAAVAPGPVWICISGSLNPWDAVPKGFDGVAQKPASALAMRELVEQWFRPDGEAQV